MYLILNLKVDFGQQKANSLDYVKVEVIEKVSGNLTTVSVALNNPESSCIQLNEFLTLTEISNRIVVISDSGEILNTGISGQNLQVQISGNTFFRIYESEEFAPQTGILNSCQLLSEGQGYTLGLVRDSKEIFESKVVSLLNNYTTDYDNLKKDMKISESDEFGFIFIDKDGNQIRTPEKNLSGNVYVGGTPVQYVKTNGAIESGFLNTIIW